MNGPGMVAAQVSFLLKQADMLAGSRCTNDELEMITRMAVQNFRHRSMESLVLAIRNGIERTDERGKIYGKLTWSTVKVWLDDHEQAIMGMVEDEHAQRVVKNDNLGADWMNRQEHDAGMKDRMIDRLRRQLEIVKKQAER